MRKLAPMYESINEVATNSINRGIAHLSVDKQINGREVIINGRRITNLGSCSYLGLENHSFLKEGAIRAIEEHGTQFSSSRSFLALGMYRELEELLGLMFGYPTIATATTSLGHIAAIPLLIQAKDAVILDHQVHASVSNAVKMVKANGTHVEMIRHSNLEMLERSIKKLSEQYDQIWYMADGIYSMYGDKAPVKELVQLLDQYEQFHLYIDDAHGMSWTGKNGCGFVLSEIDLHEKMIIATSLNKSFASGGGALICPSEEVKKTILKCGSTLIFSGPVQPAILGSSIASAQFHLSDELPKRQKELQSKMQWFIHEAKKWNLPLVMDDETPVFCIGVGKTQLGYELVEKMLEQGYYINLAIYPAVPIKNTGLRMTTTWNNTKEDITNMLATLSEQLDELLIKHNSSREEIYRAFRMKAKAKVFSK